MKRETEKVIDYSNLGIQIKETWKLKCVKIVPLITSMEGITTGTLVQSMKTLNLAYVLVIIMDGDKPVMLSCCMGVRNCTRLRCIKVTQQLKCNDVIM